MQGSCFRTFRGQATAIATLGGKRGRRETEHLGLPPFAMRPQQSLSRTSRSSPNART
jgi:hypothetical protein